MKEIKEIVPLARTEKRKRSENFQDFFYFCGT